MEMIRKNTPMTIGPEAVFHRAAWLRLSIAAALAVGAGVLMGADAATVLEKKDYPIRPVPFTQVRVTDAFWLPRLETNRTATIPFLFKKNEETGRIDNFAIAGGLIKGKYRGERYNDTDVYKPIEGASYSLMVHPDPALDRALDELIAKIASAQEPDGYLFTARTCDPAHPQPGIGLERWVEETVSHELYNAGHLYEAAVAHFLATGKRTLLDVAIKNADLVASVFGPDKRHGFPGHQEIELALVKLYRVSGNEKYLNLAKYFLDQRGREVKLTQYPRGNRFAIYNDPEQIQAHKPVLEQDEAVGHAVRLTYMAAGMADVAAIFGDPAYLAASERLWRNVVGRKMYLTGGVGSRHDRERFGEDYELPNLTAYAETCASIGMALWNQRMFLLTGEARYIDVLERALYNGILSGVSLDGRSFFYANPLASDGRFKFNQDGLGRAPFFETACCPGNLSRFLPSVPGYVYAVRDDELYVNLFIAGTAKIDVGAHPVAVVQETRYPWDGAVRIRLDPETPAEFAVWVRVPGWARNEPVPSDLYRYAAQKQIARAVFRINGAPAEPVLEKGFARFRRTWKKGDRIDVVWPMEARLVLAHASAKDDIGRVAVERGPLVYCAEGVDNGGVALALTIPSGAGFHEEWRPDLLNGVMVLKSTVSPVGGRPLVLVPYYVWAHRGPGEMAVWLNKAGD
jgi:hypothetical protein